MKKIILVLIVVVVIIAAVFLTLKVATSLGNGGRSGNCETCQG
jgi:hypothetical protein